MRVIVFLFFIAGEGLRNLFRPHPNPPRRYERRWAFFDID